MIYAYCVRRGGEPAPPDGATGVDGAGVRLIEHGGLGLWVSEIDRPRPSPDRLREHDRVVRAALRSATPLPIRFGAAVFPDEAAAREAVEERRGAFTEALERVAGRVEMGIRVEWDRPSADAAAPAQPSPARAETAGAPGSGRAYLEARRRDLTAAQALTAAAGAVLDRIERELGLEGVPTVRTVHPQPGVAGLLAHLVRRTGVSEYRRRVDGVRAAAPEHTISISGPWAPYSFVRDV